MDLEAVAGELGTGSSHSDRQRPIRLHTETWKFDKKKATRTYSTKTRISAELRERQAIEPATAAAGASP